MICPLEVIRKYAIRFSLVEERPKNTSTRKDFRADRKTPYWYITSAWKPDIDIHFGIDSEGRLRKKLYDKRDDFNIPIQLIWYSRACGSYQDFHDRGLLLTRKLLNQGFLLVTLESSLRKVYGRHNGLINRYGISVSQMTTDMFHLS